MTWPRVEVRPARREELPRLHELLAEQKEYYEQQDLSRSIVYVATYGDEIVGFSAARLIWQVEPVLLRPDFRKHAPRFAQQKATYLLIRLLERWLADRSRNTTGIYSYFCSIRGKIMQQLALSFRMMRVYRWCKFFGKDL